MNPEMKRIAAKLIITASLVFLRWLEHELTERREGSITTLPENDDEYNE